MHEITTTIDIDAPSDTVWRVLTDFAAYPEWNSRSRIEGTAREGERLVVTPGPDAEGMPTFKPRVLRAADGELRWLGHLFVRGLFDGEHVFRIESLDESRSRMVQSETFTGLLVGPLMRRYGTDTENGFRLVNESLKTRAESFAAADAVA